MSETPVIAIVDDDQSVREGAMELIKSMGFNVEAFERAEEFLRSSRLNTTSCLITDVRMPGMNGLELYDRLIALGKSIPTIVITAFPQDTDRIRALRAGVACYLPKPVDENALARCITLALGSTPESGRRP